MMATEGATSQKRKLVAGIENKLNIKTQDKDDKPEARHHKVASVLEWLRNVDIPADYQDTNGIINDDQYGDLTDEDEWRKLPSSCYGLAILSMLTDVGFRNYIAEEGTAACCGRRGGKSKKYAGGGGGDTSTITPVEAWSAEDVEAEETIRARLNVLQSRLNKKYDDDSKGTGLEEGSQSASVEKGATEGSAWTDANTSTKDKKSADVTDYEEEGDDDGDDEEHLNECCRALGKMGIDSAATSAVLIIFLILYLIGCGVPLVVILCVGITTVVFFMLFLDYYSITSVKMTTSFAHCLTNFMIPCVFSFLVQFFLIVELWKSLPQYELPYSNFCGNSDMSQLCIIGVFYSAVCPTLNDIFIEFLIVVSSHRAIFRKEIKGKDTLFIVELPFDWTLRLRLLILVFMEFAVFLGVLIAGTKYVLTSDGCGNLIQAGLATCFINEIDNMFFDAFVLDDHQKRVSNAEFQVPLKEMSKRQLKRAKRAAWKALQFKSVSGLRGSKGISNLFTIVTGVYQMCGGPMAIMAPVCGVVMGLRKHYCGQNTDSYKLVYPV